MPFAKSVIPKHYTNKFFKIFLLIIIFIIFLSQRDAEQHEISP